MCQEVLKGNCNSLEKISLVVTQKKSLTGTFAGLIYILPFYICLLYIEFDYKVKGISSRIGLDIFEVDLSMIVTVHMYIG